MEGHDDWLGGERILVIRPAGQSEALVQAIRVAGGVPVELPTIDILPVEDPGALDEALRTVQRYDLVVFVSANAVRQFAARAGIIGTAGLPALRRAAAPGPATAMELSRGGVANVVYPRERFDSEGLVEELRATGQEFTQVLIVRGGGSGDNGEGSGREALAGWLRSRGARVDSVAAYLRRPAGMTADRRNALLASPRPAALLVSSSEGGRHLVTMLGEAGRAWLAGAVVLVPHVRIATAMREAGFADVRVTAGGDAGLMAGLARHFRVAPA